MRDGEVAEHAERVRVRAVEEIVGVRRHRVIPEGKEEEQGRRMLGLVGTVGKQGTVAVLSPQ